MITGGGTRRRAYIGAVAILIAVALSACGTETAPTSVAVRATRVASPTPSRDADPTLVPSAPTTSAFLNRAHAVERAVRAAGIPPAPAGIFLYSSRTPGLAFDTTEQKLAWSAGQVTAAPGVKFRSGGRSRIDFADGSSLPVSVLDARPALAGAIGTTAGNCRGIATCNLTITGASLRTVEVDTSSGTATVPAWSYTAEGLSRPIVVVAVSEDVLKPLVEPVPPPGLTELDPPLLGVESLTRIEGSTEPRDL